ncbi:FAD-dependent oxidoreductase [Streptomyces sp. NPDC001288]|uniref:FAD-dependent oxidoreductase n=1 Tax=Streptomyces sp. NPDC001297 TaxID=3364559 RepID=UPI00367B0AA3
MAKTSVVGRRAAEPVDYVETIWPRSGWTIGGYGCYVTPGGWTGHGEGGWRTPHGLVHWAGTETASVWNGYIDGAISSGERAADEVISALESVSRPGTACRA